MDRHWNLKTKPLVLALVAGAAVAAEPAQVDPTTAEAAAALEARSSLQGVDPDYGVVYQSQDGNYRIKLGGLFQFRYTLNFRDEEVNGDDDAFTHGFSIPRARIDLSGHLGTPDLSFRVTGDFEDGNSSQSFVGVFQDLDGNGSADTTTTITNNSNGEFLLREAFVNYRLAGVNEGLYLGGGQFVNPVLTEEIVRDEFQLAADRSAVNEIFTHDRTQGIFVTYRDESFKLTGTVNDGIRTANSGFTESREADIALSARVDFKAAGSWDDFEHFTSFRDSNRAFKAGAGVHWQDGGGTGINTTDADLVLYTADLWWESNGFTAFAAFIGQSTQATLTGVPGNFDFNDFGVVAQLGYFIAQDIQIFGRWDGAFLDDDRNFADDTWNFVTLGANFFPITNSHAIRFTTDVVWSINENVTQDATGATPAGSTVGLAFAQNDSEVSSLIGQLDNDEVAVRAQLGVAW